MLYHDTSFTGIPRLGDQITFKAMPEDRAKLSLGKRFSVFTSLKGVHIEGEVLGMMGSNVTLRVDQITDQRT